ncbi:MAG: DUF1768 domain-containing protein [candidate division Zixibacteria bacterium]|nr:DUF1768 domain-containing protein [candidate division Zixibacteria bacterium]
MITNTIQFNQSHEWLSNGSRHPIIILDMVWPTVEHYYQGRKFCDSHIINKIREAKSPDEAMWIAHQEGPFVASSKWECIKNDVMLQALKCKFTQHLELGELLVGTRDANLLYRSDHGNYWGDGSDGTGRNMLGRFIMRVRGQLQRDVKFKDADSHTIRELVSIVACNPEDIDWLLELAESCYRVGQYDKTIKAALRITQLAPERESGFYYLALALNQIKEYEEALEAITELVDRYPKDSEFHVILADVYRGLGQLTMAEFHMHRSKQLGGSGGRLLDHDLDYPKDY